MLFIQTELRCVHNISIIGDSVNFSVLIQQLSFNLNAVSVTSINRSIVQSVQDEAT